MHAAMATKEPTGSQSAQRSPRTFSVIIPYNPFLYSCPSILLSHILLKVTMKSLEETVKEQSGQEFLAMVEEVKTFQF